MKFNKIRNIFLYVLVLIGLVVTLTIVSSNTKNEEKLKYSQVITYFGTNQVLDYTLDLGSGELVYYLKSDPTVEKVYMVPNVGLFIDDVKDAITVYNENEANKDNQISITFDYKRPANNWWLEWLPFIFLAIIMVVTFLFIMRQSGGGSKVMNFGKAKAKPLNLDGKNRITFDNVAGADEEKADLEEIVEFLKAPDKFNALGARIPRGVLLVGPPGTGKTLLAKAVAGESKVPFFSISGSDFVEMFVGVGAARVRDIFESAKKEAPSIIFIDEIDAVGRHRGAGLGGGHDEREQTLNQLLVEMDGFGTNSGVIVMAATNRRDILDPALLRPGRFDRQIVVNYPDIKGREEILIVHSKNKPLAPDVNLKTIAKTTAGFTGADLENLLNEAALLAAREGKKAITMAEIGEATIKVVVGPEKKSRVMSEKERKLTAYHEAGHAVVSYFCKSQDPVHQVSIIPRGMAGGYTMHLPSEDKTYGTRNEMFESIIVLLAGRIAEQNALDDISTGASNDIERATKTAKAMVTKYGFSDKLGPIQYGSDNSEVFLGRDFAHNRDFSENVSAQIDEEIKQLIEKAYSDGDKIIKDNFVKLTEIAEYLLEHEKLDGDQFEKLMKGEKTIDDIKTEEDSSL